METIKRILGLLLLLIALGCSESYLDLHSKTNISSENFWQTEEDIQFGVNGIYAVLQSGVLYGGSWFSPCSLTHYDSFTDNQWNRIKFEGPGFYVRGTLDPSTRLFKDFWEASYRGVARCNNAIANIERPDSQVPEEIRKAYLGQTYFLRALFYFNLSVYYEDVPLILEVQTLEDAYVAKNTQREVLDQVIEDLQKASELLPESHPEELYGYATKGAANGLLARVFLFDQQWGNAAEAALKVINSNQYNLSAPYEEQFTYDGEHSNDVVFSVRFQEADGFNSTENTSRTTNASPKWTHQPLANLINDFYCTDGSPITESALYDPDNPKENRDPRLLASVYFKGDVFNFDQDIVFRSNDTGYGIKKYLRNRVTSNGTPLNEPAGQDFYVIRYADVLLMRAEALIESGGNTAEIYSLINQVRDRVGMPHIEDAEGAGLGQGELRNVLRHERRVELAFEGLRFFDLKRWGTVDEAYQQMKDDPSNFPDKSLIIYQERKSETFPVPLTELDANPNLEQHEAW